MSYNPNRRESGFSLVELLIVVVVIGVVAAIAIPNLMASRRSANEGSAISDLRLFHGAQITYATSMGQGNFAGDTTLMAMHSPNSVPPGSLTAFLRLASRTGIASPASRSMLPGRHIQHSADEPSRSPRPESGPQAREILQSPPTAYSTRATQPSLPPQTARLSADQSSSPPVLLSANKHLELLPGSHSLPPGHLFREY